MGGINFLQLKQVCACGITLRAGRNQANMHTYSHYGFINEAQGISQMPPDPILSGNEILFKMGGKPESKGLTWMRAKN